MIIEGMYVPQSVEEILLQLQCACPNLKDVKPTAGNVMVTCPAHEGKYGGLENRPSCGVLLHDEKVVRDGKTTIYKQGIAHCFTCGYTASFCEFVSKVLGYDDGGIEGMKWLIKNFVSAEIENRKLDIQITRGNEKPHKYVTEQQLQQYRYIHPYMYQRRLTDRIINLFDVGYDKDKDCLTFPVKDLKGNVVFIQRRAVKGKFFNNSTVSKELALYGAHEVIKYGKPRQRLYIVESILDALTVWAYGGIAVALMGLVMLPNYLKIVKSLPQRSVVLALDNDDKGQSAKQTIKNQLKNYKILYDFKYPSNMKDINDMPKEMFLNLNLELI